MPTLEEQIAGLSQEVSGLSETGQNLIDEISGKVAEINQALNAAVAVAPESHRAIYVDSITGDDEINLGTSGSPFKTIKKAFDSLPQNGSGVIELSINKTYEIGEDVIYSGKKVNITAQTSPATPAERPLIRFLHHEGGGYNNLFSFKSSSYSGSISFTHCNIEVDTTFNAGLLPSDAYTCIQCSGYSTGSNFYINQCAVDLGENAAPLLNTNNACSTLTMLLADFEATSGNIVVTGASGIAQIAINSCTKEAGASWYDNAAQVTTNA